MNALMKAPLEDAPTGELVSYLEDALVNTDIVVRKTAFELLGHAGNADDFEPALAMLGEALSGLDTIRREAVAEAPAGHRGGARPRQQRGDDEPGQEKEEPS